MRRVQLAGSVVLTLLACVSQAFSQATADDLILKIATDKATFSEQQKAKIRLRVENKTGQAIKDEGTSVSFYLTAHGMDLGRCTNTDCFVAHAVLSKKLRGGQASESELDLAGLHWKPLISAFSQGWPRNMFKVIPPGEYHLFMRIVKRPDKSDTRAIDSRSNGILIKVDGKR